MFDNKCPHCGSKYITYQKEEDSFEKSSKIYYCQSCKKNFSVDTPKASASGQWLMTVYGDKSFREYRRKLEIYKTETGFMINQLVDGKHITKTMTPKVKVQHNQYIHKYFLWFDTFTYFNDSTGTYVTPDKIEMNKELTEKALQSEAMKIVHRGGNEFSVGEGYTETVLLNDIANWFNSVFYTDSGASGGGCYVATAVYGSYNCPQVWTLRRFRDQQLAATWYGRAFIRTYYAVSPRVVKLFGHTKWFNRFWRARLDRMVARLQARGLSDAPYNDRSW